jgi:hypothetical protein
MIRFALVDVALQVVKTKRASPWRRRALPGPHPRGERDRPGPGAQRRRLAILGWKELNFLALAGKPSACRC